MRASRIETNDNLLSQATCAVLLNDSLKGTAWLVSNGGLLLTAGHIFARLPDPFNLQVQFLNEAPRLAHKLTYTYSPDSGDDFAVLQLEDPSTGRRPLPVALIRSVEGRCKLQGYGKTLYNQSAGQGEFVGMFYPQNFTDNFLFKLRSSETGEPGFSGAAVFSESLGAVVAIQTEATTAEIGAERDTVLSMPLFRIAQRWSLLSKLSEKVHVDSPTARKKFKSPKHYLEHQIHECYQRFNNNIEASSTLKDKYQHVTSVYLQIYFILCGKLRQPPNPQVLDIKNSFPDITIPTSTYTLSEQAHSALYTDIPSSRINVNVSQMFRIADLLTKPESVKARRFYEAITSNNKLRRAFSARSSFKLGSLGSLRPVVGKSEDYDRFWKPAIPDFRLPTVHPLCFIPYELSLTDHLKPIKLDNDVGGAVGLGTSNTIKNAQITGRLRIYPPGIGIIKISIALKFKENIAVEAAAQIAHNAEDLLFVGPGDLRRPYNSLMLDIIDRVIKSLFIDEGYSFEERRWRPPATVFSFPEAQTFSAESYVSELGYLMSLAPANGEDLHSLQTRIMRELRTPHWKTDKILAIAGDGAALFFVGDLPNGRNQERREKLLLWLSETYELISAAAYAQQAYAEEVDKIFNQKLLDESWLPENQVGFEYLTNLLETMLQVTRAISALSGERGHLQKQGTGILRKFAKDIWTYNNPINRPALVKGLEYINDWLSGIQTDGQDIAIKKLQGTLLNLLAIDPSFRNRFSPTHIIQGSVEQVELEESVLTLVAELESILQREETEEFEEKDRHYQMMQKLRNQIGL
jgi:Trypsin-like peptidase domain